jgi:hypothetical protein
MPQSSSSSDRLSEYCTLLGDDSGRLYYALENEYFWVRLKWQEYLTLFASDRRVELLNSAAPVYFQMLQDALSDDILMHFARLTDRPRMGPKANLTLRSLPDSTDGDPARLEELVQTAVAKAAFATDWRNRRLAHRDLGLAMDESVQPLQPATRDAIDSALDACHAIFSHVCSSYFGSHLDPEIVEAPGGAEALLFVIRDGLRYRQAQLERLETAILTPDDLEPLPS